jgi:murein DD-endopeptidase MepM/ murein hydrolase activator NlpD
MNHRHSCAVFLGICASTISSCAPVRTSGTSEWILPFALDDSNGCATIVTPYSVANPWDHAHEGLDFACEPGSEVLAVAEGEVSLLGQVEIRQETRYRVALTVEGGRWRVEYVNLAEAFALPGDRLQAGEPLGLSALGLHVAIWSEDEGRYVDPGRHLPLEALSGTQ